jgi:hypothetical protein
MCCALLISRSSHFRSWSGVESRWRSRWRAELTTRSRVEGQRFKVRGGDRGGGGDGDGVSSQRYQFFTKRSRESNQVIDLIFELKSIHVGEVAYKWSRTIGR